MNRVSTLGLNTTMLNNVMLQESTLGNLRIQESSGIISSTYDGYGANSGQLLSLETNVNQAQAWSDGAQLTGQRTQAMYSAVGTMIDTITQLRTQLSQALSGAPAIASPNLPGQGSTAVQDLVGQMNAQFNGLYIFGGNQTLTAPVDLTGYPNPVSAAYTGYYKGDTGLQSVRISSQQTMTYGVLANSTGFEEALRSAQMVSQLSASPTAAQLQAAFDLAGQALTDLGASQSTISNQAARLQSVQQDQGTFITMTNNFVSNVRDVDVAQVAAKVSQYQTQLQASFSAMAGAMKLNLASYL